jgi:hypothetical protein
MKQEQDDLTPFETFIRSVYVFSVPIFPCPCISEQNGV